MTTSDFYQDLNISSSANIDQIKQAFKLQFENYKNLKNPTAEDQQQILQAKKAFDVLANQQLRQEYDKNLSTTVPFSTKNQSQQDLKPNNKNANKEKFQSEVDEFTELETNILQAYMHSDDKYTKAGPWTRFIARQLDFMLCIIIVALFLIFVMPELFDVIDNLGKLAPVAYGFLAFVLEVLIYAIFKNTLFKAMLDIHLVNKNSEQIGRIKYLMRNCQIFVEGFGVNFLITTLIAHIAQYKQLKLHGSTSYDRRTKTIVISSHPKFMLFFAWFLYFLIIGGFIAAFIFAQTISH